MTAAQSQPPPYRPRLAEEGRMGASSRDFAAAHLSGFARSQRPPTAAHQPHRASTPCQFLCAEASQVAAAEEPSPTIAARREHWDSALDRTHRNAGPRAAAAGTNPPCALLREHWNFPSDRTRPNAGRRAAAAGTEPPRRPARGQWEIPPDWRAPQAATRTRPLGAAGLRPAAARPDRAAPGCPCPP